MGDSARSGGVLKITESDKLAIVASRAAGVPVNELAARYKVSRQTISNVLSGLKDAQRKDAKEEFDAMTYRSTLRRKGYKAVEAGLDCEDDQYKRGNLGAVVLKGLGDFTGESINLNVQQFIASIPEDMRERYLTLDDVTEVSAAEGNGRYITSGGE